MVGLGLRIGGKLKLLLIVQIAPGAVHVSDATCLQKSTRQGRAPALVSPLFRSVYGRVLSEVALLFVNSFLSCLL